MKAANDILMGQELYLLWHFYVFLPRNFIFLITRLQVLQTISSVASEELFVCLDIHPHSICLSRMICHRNMSLALDGNWKAWSIRVLFGNVFKCTSCCKCRQFKKQRYSDDTATYLTAIFKLLCWNPGSSHHYCRAGAFDIRAVEMNLPHLGTKLNLHVFFCFFLALWNPDLENFVTMAKSATPSPNLKPLHPRRSHFLSATLSAGQFEKSAFF